MKRVLLFGVIGSITVFGLSVLWVAEMHDSSAYPDTAQTSDVPLAKAGYGVQLTRIEPVTSTTTATTVIASSTKSQPVPLPQSMK